MRLRVAVYLAKALKTTQLTQQVAPGRLESNLAKFLGHTSASGELHKQIKRLLAHELIEMTLADKPNSRLQRYRLTADGRGCMALTLPPTER